MEHPENDDLYKGLKVNKGVTDVPTVNPYLRKRVQRKQYTPAEYVEGILKGNITILSQAVTLVESAKHEHQQIAQEIIAQERERLDIDSTKEVVIDSPKPDTRTQ